MSRRWLRMWSGASPSNKSKSQVLNSSGIKSLPLRSKSTILAKHPSVVPKERLQKFYKNSLNFLSKAILFFSSPSSKPSIITFDLRTSYATIFCLHSLTYTFLQFSLHPLTYTFLKFSLSAHRKMGFLKPFFAASLAIVFLSQITTICAGRVQPRIEMMPAKSSNVGLIPRNHLDNLPAGSSDIGLFPRQDQSDDWRYFGHRCRIEGQIDPIPPPGQLTCEPPPHGKHNDAREHKLMQLADHFCENYFDTRNGTAVQDPVRLPLSKTFWLTTQSKDTWPQPDIFLWEKNMEPHNDVWSFTVDWVYGCSTDDLPPITLDDCATHFWEAWRACTGNKGAGGTLSIGCYRYTAQSVF